jgi:hypothetical protein
MTANSFLGAGTRSQHLPKGSSDVSNAKDARRRNGGMKTQGTVACLVQSIATQYTALAGVTHRSYALTFYAL